MPGIYVGNNENLENALRRFKRQIEKVAFSQILKRKNASSKKDKVVSSKRKASEKQKLNQSVL